MMRETRKLVGSQPIVPFAGGFLLCGGIDALLGTHLGIPLMAIAALWCARERFTVRLPWWSDLDYALHRVKRRANDDGWTRVARIELGDGRPDVVAYVRPEMAPRGERRAPIVTALRIGDDRSYLEQRRTAMDADGRCEIVVPASLTGLDRASRIEAVAGAEPATFRPTARPANRAGGRAGDREAPRAPRSAEMEAVQAILRAADLRSLAGIRAAKAKINKAFHPDVYAGADKAAAANALGRANDLLHRMEKRLKEG